MLLFALIAGFAAIGNWIAFGVGPRACGVDLAGFFVASGGASDLVCRAGFGVGALILNGTLVAMLAHEAGIGPGPSRPHTILARLESPS